MNDYTFKRRRLIATMLRDKGLLMSPDRFSREEFELEDYDGTIIRYLITVLVQDEELFRYPADWWQATRARWLPQWLKKRYPVRYAEVWAQHKFPELDSPVGAREFVTIKVVKDEQELLKLKESERRTGHPSES